MGSKDPTNEEQVAEEVESPPPKGEESEDAFKMISKKEFKEKYNVSDYLYLLRDYF